MPPPSSLAIATSSLLRLVKEESSYHSELETQGSRLRSALEKQQQNKGDEDDDEENGEFMIKQQVSRRTSLLVYDMKKW